VPGWDYSHFKDGQWLITLNRQQRLSDFDRFWLETLMCLIEESFDGCSDDVCGAAVNVRAKGDKIAVWTTECENRKAVTHTGRVYKERSGLTPKIVISYQSHIDTATKNGSTTKNRFVI
uniref:Eukaryotic translation initiation factor 4E family member 1B n=1 Tax=Cebus imitator TaxID=2715852 RepID=A0A2K5RBZ8_CEBIM